MSHPAKSQAAIALRDQLTSALEAAQEIQRIYPHVADYRLTGIIDSLREAADYSRNLADGETPGLAEAHAKMMIALGYEPDKVTSYWAQIKDAHEGAGWRTVRTSEESGHDAAWGALTDDMQRRGLRYGELAAHIADMERGDVLSAEDGTEYRILKSGQEIAQ